MVVCSTNSFDPVASIFAKAVTVALLASISAAVAKRRLQEGAREAYLNFSDERPSLLELSESTGTQLVPGHPPLRGAALATEPYQVPFTLPLTRQSRSSPRMMLPSSLRLKMPFNEAGRLHAECNNRASSSAPLLWRPDVVTGWECMAAIFQAVDAGKNATLALPALLAPKLVDDAVLLLEKNSAQLHDVRACALGSSAPAPMVRLLFRTGAAIRARLSDDESSAAVDAMRTWTSDTLCAQRLCPFTPSASRAAVGLESVGVQAGPIDYRVVGPPAGGHPSAAALASAFWVAVCDMARLGEQDLATVLLAAPAYDDDFASFVSVCDDLLQPSVTLAGAEQIIGRAWFHPRYAADSVGHSDVVPGHAVPHTMVRDFFGQVGSGPPPPLSDVARANDRIRRTPHATINLLRRSQLKAAKRLEAASPNAPPPNSVYVRNVLRVLRG